MRFEFIAKHRGAWRTQHLCEALGVSRGGTIATILVKRDSCAGGQCDYGDIGE